MLEIAVSSGKCHVLDLFALPHSGAQRGWGPRTNVEMRVCSGETGAVRLR